MEVREGRKVYKGLLMSTLVEAVESTDFDFPNFADSDVPRLALADVVVAVVLAEKLGEQLGMRIGWYGMLN